MAIVLLLSFLFFVSLGVPIAFAIGVAAIFAFLFQGSLPLTLVPQRMFVVLDGFTLLAVPFFMLAGELMESGGITQRLIKFSSSLIGHFRGGLGMVSIVASMIFAGISGSGIADTAAIGVILIPAMIHKGYPKGFVASLQASAGSIGPIMPPSILMIIYCSITSLSIGKMFLAGFVPGLMLGLFLIVIVYVFSRLPGYEAIEVEKPSSLAEILISLKESFGALMAPVIIIGGIVSGIFTATEAGAIVAVYAFILGFFVHRELKLRDLKKVFTRAAMLTATFMFIVSVANIFGWILARERFAEVSRNLIFSISENPNITILLVLLFLLIVGCFVEITAATIILAPILRSIGDFLGFDPIHFGLIVVIVLGMGGLTPPIGALLFVSCGIADCSIIDASKYLLPFLLASIFVVIIITYFPGIVLFLPRLMFPS